VRLLTALVLLASAPLGGRLVQWSAPYRIMPSLTDRNSDETALANELREVLPPSGQISSDDAATVRRTAGRLRVANQGLERGSQLLLARIAKIGVPVPTPIQRALLAKARAIYGGCVRVPDLGVEPAAQGLEANLHAVMVK